MLFLYFSSSKKLSERIEGEQIKIERLYYNIFLILKVRYRNEKRMKSYESFRKFCKHSNKEEKNNLITNNSLQFFSFYFSAVIFSLPLLFYIDQDYFLSLLTYRHNNKLFAKHVITHNFRDYKNNAAQVEINLYYFLVWGSLK